MEKRFKFLAGIAGMFFVMVVVVLTAYLAGRNQNPQSRASTPTGVALMCLNGINGVAVSSCASGATSFVGTYNPDASTIETDLVINSGTQQFSGFAAQVFVPATNVNLPVITALAPFNTTPWSVSLSNVVLDTANSRYVISFAAFINLNGITPPSFSSDTKVAHISIPLKVPATLPLTAPMAIAVTFEPTQTKMTQGVDATDILKTPVNPTFTLNGDTTAPTMTITGGPAAGGTVTTSTVTFTYTGSDNLTAPALLKFSTQLDNGAASAFTTATSYTTPVLTPGLHTVTFLVKDSSNNVSAPVTRSLTFAPVSGLLIRAKFAGIAQDRGPIVATAVVVQDQVAAGAVHQFQQTFSGSTALTFNWDVTSLKYQTTTPNLSLAAGTNYEILIKGPSHLQTRVTPAGFSLTAAQLGTTTTIDTSSVTVRAGDVRNILTNPQTDGQDGQLTIEDLAAVTFWYTSIAVPMNPSIATIRDINKDGFITIDDVTLISNNFTAGVVPDDK